MRIDARTRLDPFGGVAFPIQILTRWLSAPLLFKIGTVSSLFDERLVVTFVRMHEAHGRAPSQLLFQHFRRDSGDVRDEERNSDKNK